MRWMMAAVVACALCALAAPAAQAQQFRSIWADAFHIGYKSAAEIDALVARAVEGRYNAIIAEVLAHHDSGSGGHGAYWNSAIVPKAADIAGGIDPLAYLISRAHANNIEVHAWLVTYRACSVWPPAGNATLAAHPEWLMVPQAAIGGGPAKVDGVYVLDPGSPDVQEYLISIVRELVANYEVDGINWDYIRYTVTDAGYPASNSYANSGLARFQRITPYVGVPATSQLQWSDFRRRTIDELVRRCRGEIPLIKSNPRQPLRLTADLICFGNAPASFASSSAYGLFQNWQLWLQRGWLDAGVPMNYKEELCVGSENLWFRNWVDAAVSWRGSRHIYAGQATYMNTFAESVTQMQYAYAAGAQGTANYSYVGTRRTSDTCNVAGWASDWGWYPYVGASLFTTIVPTPSMPWRDPATATEGTIFGRVTNGATGLGYDDVAVQVGRLPGVRTDANGYYTMTLVSATAEGNSNTLTVSRDGLSVAHGGAYSLAGDVTRYDFALGSATPLIQISATSFSRSLEAGQTATDSLMVSAGEANTRGPVNWFASDDADWLTALPRQGSSFGEADELTLIYDTNGLGLGTYSATLTVMDALASPASVSIPVQLVVRPPLAPGDFDADGDVDQDDFAVIQRCVSELPSGWPVGCEVANLDADTNIDAADVEMFLGCFSGPGVPAEVGCTNP